MVLLTKLFGHNVLCPKKMYSTYYNGIYVVLKHIGHPNFHFFLKKSRVHPNFLDQGLIPYRNEKNW